METLVTFSLGAGAVLIILGIVAVVRLVKQVKELAEAVSVLELEVSQNEQLINRRVDQEIDRVDQIYTNVLSIIDSRLDKLETKITNNKQVLKG
jgi:predicted PurR-regulated permease PerM